MSAKTARSNPTITSTHNNATPTWNISIKNFKIVLSSSDQRNKDNGPSLSCVFCLVPHRQKGPRPQVCLAVENVGGFMFLIIFFSRFTKTKPRSVENE